MDDDAIDADIVDVVDGDAPAFVREVETDADKETREDDRVAVQESVADRDKDTVGDDVRVVEADKVAWVEPERLADEERETDTDKLRDSEGVLVSEVVCP